MNRSFRENRSPKPAGITHVLRESFVLQLAGGSELSPDSLHQGQDRSVEAECFVSRKNSGGASHKVRQRRTLGMRNRKPSPDRALQFPRFLTTLEISLREVHFSCRTFRKGKCILIEEIRPSDRAVPQKVVEICGHDDAEFVDNSRLVGSWPIQFGRPAAVAIPLGRGENFDFSSRQCGFKVKLWNEERNQDGSLIA